MLSSNTIFQLANKYQTTELNIRREYVQHLFLSYLYQHEAASGIYFKGGTALRIVYNSPRFSEDLDFDASVPDIKLIETVVLATINQLEREGMKVSIEESKETSGGYLGICSFEMGEQTVQVRLEISFRQKNYSGQTVVIAGDFIPPYTMVQLQEEQLVGEKIQALLSRQKPRDYYDMYYMLRASLLSPAQKSMLSQVLAVLKKTEIDFEHELKQFLPRSHWTVIRDFRSTLTRELERTVA